jgi:hypothetical protein
MYGIVKIFDGAQSRPLGQGFRRESNYGQQSPDCRASESISLGKTRQQRSQHHVRRSCYAKQASGHPLIFPCGGGEFLRQIGPNTK